MFLFRRPSSTNDSRRKSGSRLGKIRKSSRTKTQKTSTVISNTVADYKTDRDLCEALASDDWCLDTLDNSTSEEEYLVEELKRLKDLKSFNVLDSAPERRFEQISGMACREFDVPFALVSLVDMGRTWCKSIRGLGDERNCPRGIAFCPHAILAKEDVMVVADTAKDKRFVDNPLVTGPPFIKFYAGTPLLSPDGYKVGTLCIISDKVRAHGMTFDEKERLKELAGMAVQILVQRRLNKEMNVSGMVNGSERVAESSYLSSPPKEFDFGGLTFSYVDKFDLRWKIHETAKHSSVSFYHPIVPDGFHPFSSISSASLEDVNGKEACLCVKSRRDDALKPPVKYELLWSTQGTEAELASCWRPIPPQGYVAMGDVFVKGLGSPSTSEVICVKESYAAPGVIGFKSWGLTSESGVKEDVNIYESLPTLETSRFNNCRIGVQSFLAESTTVPLKNNQSFSLLLPAEIDVRKNDSIHLELASFESPKLYSDTILSYNIPIPCTAVKVHSLAKSLRNSPLYYLEIAFKYRLELFKKDDSGKPIHLNTFISVGIDDESLNTFSVLTWVTVHFGKVINISSNTGRFSCCFELDLAKLGIKSAEEAFKCNYLPYQSNAFQNQAFAAWSTVCVMTLRDGHNETLAKPLEFALNKFEEDVFPKETFRCEE